MIFSTYSFLLVFMLTTGVRAEEAAVAAPIPGPVVEVPAPAPAAVAAPAKKRRSRVDTRETDGSVAAGRFEAQTILKSQYHLNGQQLEVDPD